MKEVTVDKKGTVAESVVEKLESLILNGVLRTGDKLPSERALSEKLGVSRPSLREAKQILVYKGILRTTQGGGTYVEKTLGSELSDPLLDLLQNNANASYDILEMRCALDSLAAYSAAQRATREDKEKIKKAYAALERLHNTKDCSSADEAEADAFFHLSIVEASHNVILLLIMRRLFKALRSSIRNNLKLFYAKSEIAGPLHDQHYRLMKAVIDGRATDARDFAKAHLKFVDQSIHELDLEAQRLNRHKSQNSLLGDF